MWDFFFFISLTQSEICIVYQPMHIYASWTKADQNCSKYVWTPLTRRTEAAVRCVLLTQRISVWMWARIHARGATLHINHVVWAHSGCEHMVQWEDYYLSSISWWQRTNLIYLLFLICNIVYYTKLPVKKEMSNNEKRHFKSQKVKLYILNIHFVLN